MKVQIKRLPHGAGLPLPEYQTPGSAGMDLLAAVAEDVTIAPGEVASVPSGIAIALPPGVEAQVRPRQRAGRSSCRHARERARHNRQRLSRGNLRTDDQSGARTVRREAGRANRTDDPGALRTRRVGRAARSARHPARRWGLRPHGQVTQARPANLYQIE